MIRFKHYLSEVSVLPKELHKNVYVEPKGVSFAAKKDQSHRDLLHAHLISLGYQRDARSEPDSATYTKGSDKLHVRHYKQRSYVEHG